MNGKQRMLAAIQGDRLTEVPVTPHWWGVYKFQLAGIVHGPHDESRGWALHGADLAQVDALFYETIHPDMIHLSTGAWQPQPGDSERARALTELRPAVIALESKRAIDEYIDAVIPTEFEIEASRIYAHVPLLVEKYGDQALIMMNEGNPVCGVFENGGPVGDFQDALVATVEHPDNLAYLLWKLYDAALGRMRVLQRLGAHGYIGSETCVSCDILSPRAFRSLILPALKHFYTTLDQMGLLPVTYFLGEILPILDDITIMGAKALMIEEPKKNFHLDALEVYAALHGRMALFGNLDSIYHLLWGNPTTITAETQRQCACALPGRFIMACGSPLCYDTPRANIEAMMTAARTYPL